MYFNALLNIEFIDNMPKTLQGKHCYFVEKLPLESPIYNLK
jgi:hypothetical protein